MDPSARLRLAGRTGGESGDQPPHREKVRIIGSRFSYPEAPTSQVITSKGRQGYCGGRSRANTAVSFRNGSGLARLPKIAGIAPASELTPENWVRWRARELTRSQRFMPVPVALTFAVDRRARLIPDGHAARESRDPSVLGRRARRREFPLKFELLDTYAGVNGRDPLSEHRTQIRRRGHRAQRATPRDPRERLSRRRRLTATPATSLSSTTTRSSRSPVSLLRLKAAPR